MDGATQGGDGGDGGVLPSGRSFPDTSASIAVLADQLPTMNQAQLQFAASHYVGTQKQLLPVTQALRALNPAFLVLHYHLAMWQSAPGVDFIVDGMTWGNDYPTVTMNESWFWHDATGQNRVASSADMKLLMNVSVPGFSSTGRRRSRSRSPRATTTRSSSTRRPRGSCRASAAAAAQARTRASRGPPRTTRASPSSGTRPGSSAWQTWISALATTLSAKGIPLIPNTGAFITGWDTTNYGLTPGIFSEGFAGTGFAVSDWQASTDELLKLAAADRIMICRTTCPRPRTSRRACTTWATICW